MIRRCLIGFLLILFVECLWQTGRNLWVFLRTSSDNRSYSSCQEIGQKIPAGLDVAFLCHDASRLDSVERHALICLNWAISPRVAFPIQADKLDDWKGYVVVRDWTGSHDDLLREKNFERLVANEFCTLFQKKTIAQSGPIETPSVASSANKEARSYWAMGLLGVIMCWIWKKYFPTRMEYDRLGCAVGLFIFLLVCTLSEDLSAPNGLGVYGGKAKLFLLSGTIPSSFWSQPEYAVFQPSYPPLMTLVAYASFLIGGINDVSLQIILPCFVSFLFLELTRKLPTRGVTRFLVLVFVLGVLLSSQMMRLVLGFYAEILAMLLLIGGWNAVFEGRYNRGLALFGLAALARPEGLILSLVSWICLILTDFIPHHKITQWLYSFCWVAWPGIIWQVFVWMMGAHLQDYNFLQGFNYDYFVDAQTEIIKTLCCDFSFNGGVFVIPVFIFIGMGILCKRRASNLSEESREIFAVGFSCVLSCFIGAVLISFSTHYDRDWLYVMTLPRYAFMSTIPVAFAVIRTSCHLTI